MKGHKERKRRNVTSGLSEKRRKKIKRGGREGGIPFLLQNLYINSGFKTKSATILLSHSFEGLAKLKLQNKTGNLAINLEIENRPVKC